MKRLLLSLLAVLLLNAAFAQQIPALPNNLNSVRSSDISDEQIVLIVQQMKLNKVTSRQAYQLMLQRGMSIIEANTIQQRIDQVMLAATELDKKSKQDNEEYDAKDANRNNRMPKIKNDTFTVKNPKRIFGLENIQQWRAQF
jgi:hypothetical protein